MECGGKRVYQSARIRPSLLHCAWGVPFFLIGAGLFGYTIFHGLSHDIDSLTQVVVPGRAELSLKRNQTYTVFLEEQSVVNGKIYSTTQPIQGLACVVTSVQNGTTIAIRKPDTSTTYELNGRSGHSVLEFSIHEDGKYLFACDYDENSRGPQVVVAVGSGVGEAIFRTVLVCLAALFGGTGAGIIVVVIVLTMRQRNKKKMLQLGQPQV